MTIRTIVALAAAFLGQRSGPWLLARDQPTA